MSLDFKDAGILLKPDEDVIAIELQEKTYKQTNLRIFDISISYNHKSFNEETQKKERV